MRKYCSIAGFTLIELLLVIGIIAILAAIVIVAVNPTKQLGDAQDSERRHNAKQLEKAQYQYLVDNEDYAGDKEIPDGEANQIQICRIRALNAGCVNVDSLVPTYIACIPYDGAETNADYTGYAIYQQVGRAQVNSLHIGAGSAASGCEEYPGPIAHWKLDEDTIGSIVVDASGNGHNGTHVGIVLPDGPSTDAPNTSFQNPYSLKYDGVDDYVIVPNNAALQLTDELSIAGWIKATASWNTSDVVHPILRKGEGNPNNYQLAINDKKVSLMLDGRDDVMPNKYQGNTILGINQWYHVAATWDGSTVNIYLNGVLDHSPGTHSHAAPIGTDVRPLYVGSRAAGNDYHTGMVDDVRLYDYALTAERVALLASSS